MLKYIHCNKCFRNEPVSETRYLLTHCGHVLCGSCLDHASDAYSGSNKTKGGTQRSLLQNDPAALNKAGTGLSSTLPRLAACRLSKLAILVHTTPLFATKCREARGRMCPMQGAL
jgi:hypothetical protein